MHQHRPALGRIGAANPCAYRPRAGAYLLCPVRAHTPYGPSKRTGRVVLGSRTLSVGV